MFYSKLKYFMNISTEYMKTAIYIYIYLWNLKNNLLPINFYYISIGMGIGTVYDIQQNNYIRFTFKRGVHRAL